LLRQKAKHTGKSLNTVSLEALKRGVGLTEESVSYTDLDDLYGAKIADSESFDKAMSWLDSLPNEIDGSLNNEG